MNSTDSIEVVLPETTYSKITFLRLAVSARSNFVYDSRLLLKFLRGKKFVTNNALKALMNYENMMKKLDLYPPIGPTLEDVEDVLRLGIFSMPNSRDKDGLQVLYIRPARFVTSELSTDQLLRCAYFCVSELTDSEEVQRHGFSIIADCTGWTFKSIKLEQLKQLFLSFQNHYPARVQRIVLVDAQRWLYSAWLMIRPHISTKHAEKWKLSCKRDHVTRYVNLSDLPDFLGGYLHFDINEWIESCRAKERPVVVYRSMQTSKDSI